MVYMKVMRLTRINEWLMLEEKVNWEGPQGAFPGVPEYQGFDRWHSQNICLGSCSGPRPVSSVFGFIPHVLPSTMTRASFAARHTFKSHF
jgi:hypothetical protein